MPPTEDDINARRRMASILMQQGASAEPVQHWTQAAARVAQALSGGANAQAARSEGVQREQYDAAESARKAAADRASSMAQFKEKAMFERNLPLTESQQLDLDYKRAQISRMQREPAGGELPSNVREYEYFSKLPPEAQQQYLNIKRAQQTLDLGTSYYQPNAANPGAEGRTITKDVAGAEAQKVIGRETGEGRMALPKLGLALEMREEKAAVLDDEIGRALQIMDASKGSTGFIGAGAKYVPGSPAQRLAELLGPIKAKVGFDDLQNMRDNSPTGGALGQVAVQELQMLQYALGSFDQNQGDQQLRYNLLRLRDLEKKFAVM
ncbi:MAG: hypothetical protein ACRCV9_13870, partial [Burkholderiaceae bacterium]